MKTLLQIVMFVAATILGAILFPISLIVNIFFFKRGSILKTLWQAIREIWEEIGNLLERLAITIDIFGNIICANLFKWLMYKNRFKLSDTLLAQSGITISSALGEGLVNKKLNKFGIGFSKFLDVPFEKNHCKNAYEWEIAKKQFNDEHEREISNG